MHVISAIIWACILFIFNVISSVDWVTIGKVLLIILSIGGGLFLLLALFGLASGAHRSSQSHRTELRPGFSQGNFYQSAVGSNIPQPARKPRPPKEASLIEKGIIIDEPWIGMILSGEKTWEMRATRARHRGPVALIKKKSKTVYGIAELYDCSDRLSLDELKGTKDKHCIPDSILEAPDYKWNVAWKLRNIRPLQKPVPYQHKGGSTIWVTLDDQAQKLISESL